MLLEIGFPSKHPTYPAGFYRSAGCFFTFYLVCVGSMLQMSAIYRLMAAASPNMDIASAAGEAQLTHSCKGYFHQALFAACCQAPVLVHSLCAYDRVESLASSYPPRLTRLVLLTVRGIKHHMTCASRHC